VDGVSVKTPIATGGKILVNGGETGLDIGGGSASTLNFHGVIDDVRIYNYGLSDAEVVQLYQGTLD
jgi:hypothetical protein